jgi:hypothetical protein
MSDHWQIDPRDLDRHITRSDDPPDDAQDDLTLAEQVAEAQAALMAKRARDEQEKLDQLATRKAQYITQMREALSQDFTPEMLAALALSGYETDDNGYNAFATFALDDVPMTLAQSGAWWHVRALNWQDERHLSFTLNAETPEARWQQLLTNLADWRATHTKRMADEAAWREQQEREEAEQAQRIAARQAQPSEPQVSYADVARVLDALLTENGRGWLLTYMRQTTPEDEW